MKSTTEMKQEHWPRNLIDIAVQIRNLNEEDLQRLEECITERRQILNR